MAELIPTYDKALITQERRQFVSELLLRLLAKKLAQQATQQELGQYE